MGLKTAIERLDLWACADETGKKGRKPIKRKEVKLGKLMGLADADEETQKAFGKDTEKADEMLYSIFRLRQLKRELAEKRELVLQEVCAPTSFHLILVLFAGSTI